MDDLNFVPIRDALDNETGSAAAQCSKGIAVTFADCFGMFHPGAAEEGILILPPFGHEALACAKSLRLLAERLAGQGYPVLRLDAPGTGDAPGEESTMEIIANRTAAAKQAAEWMRETAGLRTISVIGVRLGGAIAILAAQSIKARRILLAAPVLTGRSFLRELQHMKLFYASGDAPVENGAANEFNGFSLPEESLAQLRALDLRKSSIEGIANAAIMAPAGSVAAENLIKRWQDAGVAAELMAYDGADDLLADPATAPPALDFVAHAAGWFGAPASRANSYWQPVGHAVLAGDNYREQGCHFGEGDQVFGILCRPVRPLAGAPALILVNTGGNSHIGWGRQTVELARRLAADGITTLRLDVNGVGETPDLAGRADRVIYVEESSKDVFTAVDFMQTCGFEKPAIAGICSGAYLVFQTARRNPAICGALMINLQKFYWREGDELVLYSSVGRYISKFFNFQNWKRALSGEVNLRGVSFFVASRILKLVQSRLSAMLPSGKQHKISKPGDITQPLPRAVLSELCEHGVHISMAYTSGDGGIDEMRSQLGNAGRMVNSKQKFAYTIIDGADHNFSTAASRLKLFPVVRDFAFALREPQETRSVKAA